MPAPDLYLLERATPPEVTAQETIGGATIFASQDRGRRSEQEDVFFITAVPPANSENAEAFLTRTFADIAEKAKVKAEEVLAAEKQKMRATIDNEQAQVAAWKKQLETKTDDQQRDTLESDISEKEWRIKILQNGLSHLMSGGSTATVAMVSPERKITIAHVGDSPAYLFVRDHKSGEITAHELIKPHKLDDPVEEALIKQAGGKIVDHLGVPRILNERKQPSLNMSRALGDIDIPGILSEPTITSIDIATFLKEHGHSPENRVFLSVSSDGLYEMKNDLSGPKATALDYAAIIRQACDENKESKITNCMVEFAHRVDSSDNLSVALVEIPPTPSQGFAIGVLDGHGTSEIAKDAAQNFKDALGKTSYRDLSAREPAPTARGA